MHKILLFVTVTFLNTYAYPPNIQTLIDTINHSAGDADVSEDYINNFYGWVNKLDKFFYGGNAKADIGDVLFPAYSRYSSYPSSQNNDSKNVNAGNKMQSNNVDKQMKLLNVLVNSKDSLRAVTLKLLYENSQRYYNSFPEVQNIDYETFKKRIFDKMVKGPEAGHYELSHYLGTIKYDVEHKQEIDSICKNIFESESDSMIMIGLLNYCVSCLEDSLTDNEKLDIYIRMKGIEDSWDYHEGNFIEEKIDELKNKIGIKDGNGDY